MLLIEFIVIAVLIAAGIIFMEYKFAQMNDAESDQVPEHIEKILEKLGATEIASDGKGWYNFMLNDEVL